MPPASYTLDKAGVAVSAVCLLHCLALPLVALAIPAAEQWLGDAVDHRVHWTLLAIAAPISAAALGLGAWRTGFLRWLLLGAAGLATMLCGLLHVFGVTSEDLLTVIGVTILACAHAGNWTTGHRHAPAAGGAR